MIVLKMEPDEITSMYRDAKNKFKQVQILAEMNCVSNKEMAQWLEDHGHTVDSRYFPERRLRKTGSNIPVPTRIPPAPKKADQTAKADAGKPRLTLVPMQILWDIAEVREYGCDKYPNGGTENWKQVEEDRYWEAAFRHFLKCIHDHKAVDPESGIQHFKHLLCNLAFIAEMEASK